MSLPVPITTSLSSDEIIRGFYQGIAGNCASIAAIKAAIMAFGARPVFSRTGADGDGYVVVMRDGDDEYSFTADELEMAKRMSRFRGDHAVLLSHAHFMFAAMARRAQLENNDGSSGMSFAEAVDSLNDGEYWKEGLHWLGLERFVIEGPDTRLPSPRAAGFLADKAAGIGQSAKHTWFASMGQHDETGVPSRPRWTISGAVALDVERIAAG